MQISSGKTLQKLIPVLLTMSVLVFFACSGAPAGRSEPGLTLELFEEPSPGAAVSFAALDSSEFSRRIAGETEKRFRPPGSPEVELKLLLRTAVQSREDRSPGFLSKRYEIHLEGSLMDRDNRRIGTLLGRLEYRRSRFQLSGNDEADQYDIWDRDFVEWCAERIVEALTF